MCDIEGCDKDPTTKVQYAHENPDLRWTSAMCDDCRKETSGKRGSGEFIYLPLDKEERVNA